MSKAGQPVNKRAAVWTAGVHVILLLLFIFITYSSPSAQEPMQELGMEVNLGTDGNGSGNDQPMHVEDPAPERASVTYKSPSRQHNEAKDVLRTDDKDAPSITPAKKAAKNITKADDAVKPNRNVGDRQNTATSKTPQRPKYVYAGGAGRGGNSATENKPGGGEGNTSGLGDMGVPGGTPGASNYTGTPGSGNGISHTLSRRSIVAFPPPEADFREGGKVVIRITVNRAGQITNRQVVSASNGELRSIALRKLDKVKFNKSEDAPEEQFGNITFVFKTRS